MLTTIHIAVRDRVPTITAGEEVISHNSDYVAEFDFDEEWQDKVKTVYFVCEDGSNQPVVMSGNSCDVPMMAGEHRRIFVGVQEGTSVKPGKLKTTRPCCLKVKDSIADYLGEQIPDPSPSVYEQIIAMLNNLTTPTWDAVQNKPFGSLGEGLEVDENGVLSAKRGTGGSPNAVQYVEQTLTDEQKKQARKNIGAGTSSFSGSYNDLTNKPTIPTQVTIDSTLMQSGQAADAKAVGDALTEVDTKLGEKQPKGNYLTTESDPTVPAWAKSPTKPPYTAAEVHALPDTTVIPPPYTLPQATADALGGVKADAAMAEDTQPVRIGADGKMRTKPYSLTDADKAAVAEKVVEDGIAATLTEIPTGGGGEKEWTKILETEVTEKTAAFEVTGLENYTEFLMINSGLQNATSTNSGQNLYINGISVFFGFVDVQKSGSVTYNYSIAKFNGLVWECYKSNISTTANNIRASSANIPYCVVLGVGKATSIKTVTENSMYAPVSGKITIYGR